MKIIRIETKEGGVFDIVVANPTFHDELRMRGIITYMQCIIEECETNIKSVIVWERW